jgi:hypothetical protein
MCQKWPQICSVGVHHNPVLSSFITYHWVYDNNNKKGAKFGTGTACPSGASTLTTGF